MTDNTKLHYIDLGSLPPIDPSKPGDKLHPFYEIAFSRHWKDATICLALNVIRESDPDKDSDEKNRAVLGKLKAYIQMMDIEYAVRAVQGTVDEQEEDLPDDIGDTFRADDYLEDEN